MRNKILNIGLFLFSLSLYNCQERENKIILEKKNSMNTNNILPILIKQIEAGNDQTYSCYVDYTKEDLDALVSVEDTILKNNGYKTPDQGSFNEKIRNIFNRIIDNNSQNQYLKIDTYKDSKCDKELKFYPYSVDAQYLYVDKAHNFITYFYALPQILDYIKLFPKVKKYEKDDIIIEDKIEKVTVKASQWKDDKDLPQERRFNQKLLISRNKYLFNDDKSQFPWLITNDSIFMRSLVTDFGYTEDRRLLRWVIDNTDLDFFTLRANDKLNYAEFGSLFWTKSCDGKLKLHPNTFKIFQELYKPNDNSTRRFLLNYISGYLGYLFDENEYKGILTEEDKVKIGANLVYFSEQYKYNPEFKDSDSMMGRFRYFTSEDYKGILRKNNYYNLPKFKEWWDKAKYDEDYVTDCEYEGTCGKDNPGPDPTDPKYKNSFLSY